jgi:hypothetical protein
MGVFISNGDCLGNQLSESKWHSYPVINCRECLIVGPNATEINAHFNIRAGYLSQLDNGQSYTEKVVEEFNKIKAFPSEEEIYLWFENDLYCQVNFWFCIYLFSEWGFTNLNLVSPNGSREVIEINFGQHTEGDLEQAFHNSIKLNKDDTEHGKNLWLAYITNDLSTFHQLHKYNSPAFANSHFAINLQIERINDPLVVHKLVKSLMSDENDTFNKVWIKFQAQYPMYGFGDTQIQNIYLEILHAKA